jgi:hypothetical protein
MGARERERNEITHAKVIETSMRDVGRLLDDVTDAAEAGEIDTSMMPHEIFAELAKRGSITLAADGSESDERDLNDYWVLGAEGETVYEDAVDPRVAGAFVAIARAYALDVRTDEDGITVVEKEVPDVLYQPWVLKPGTRW